MVAGGPGASLCVDSSRQAKARKAGKSERYVSKLIRTAFLAPDLVEAVLEGRAPTRLTLAELTDDLPWDWNEQRRRFAHVLGASERLSTPSQLPCNPLAAREIPGSPRYGAVPGLQTAPKFEFSSLHQAGEFELTRSLARRTLDLGGYVKAICFHLP